jgi:hypothetical protein
VTRRTLTQTLFAEVGQTERSAIRHPRVEARRLGDCPPAAALLAIADHAARAEPAIRALAGARGGAHASPGIFVGNLFSIGRDTFADFFLTAEQSYRGTLLGIRHGYDVITLFRLAAVTEHDGEVVAWADPWLEVRRPLIDRVADQLGWFAKNPDRALENARFVTRTTA